MLLSGSRERKGAAYGLLLLRKGNKGDVSLGRRSAMQCERYEAMQGVVRGFGRIAGFGASRFRCAEGFVRGRCCLEVDWREAVATQSKEHVSRAK